MSRRTGQTRFASPSCDTEPMPSRATSGPRWALLAETALVTTVVVVAILLMQRLGSGRGVWLIGPCALLAGALLPTMIRRDAFARILPERSRIRGTVLILLATAGVAFPATLAVLWAMKMLAVPIPLRPTPGANQSWPAWLAYQLLYVAVGEECFFRGYVQLNVSSWAQSVTRIRREVVNLIVIVLSAAVFAAAHVAVQGRIVSAVTFVPGLVLAWLFVRTKSLAAPIAFHGLANAVYYLSALALG